MGEAIPDTVYSAMYSVSEQLTPLRHPLAKGARPEAIRAALLPDDQLEFDAALAAATDELNATLDLVPLFTMLDQWRRIAALQSDPERFARVAHRAAALRCSRIVRRTDWVQ